MYNLQHTATANRTVPYWWMLALETLSAISISTSLSLIIITHVCMIPPRVVDGNFAAFIIFVLMEKWSDFHRNKCRCLRICAQYQCGVTITNEITRFCDDYNWRVIVADRIARFILKCKICQPPSHHSHSLTAYFPQQKYYFHFHSFTIRMLASRFALSMVSKSYVCPRYMDIGGTFIHHSQSMQHINLLNPNFSIGRCARKLPIPLKLI